jgi:hypothetical protein
MRASDQVGSRIDDNPIEESAGHAPEDVERRIADPLRQVLRHFGRRPASFAARGAGIRPVAGRHFACGLPWEGCLLSHFHTGSNQCIVTICNKKRSCKTVWRTMTDASSICELWLFAQAEGVLADIGCLASELYRPMVPPVRGCCLRDRMKEAANEAAYSSTILI